MPDASTFLMIPETRYSRSLDRAITVLRRHGRVLEPCSTQSADESSQADAAWPVTDMAFEAEAG